MPRKAVFSSGYNREPFEELVRKSTGIDSLKESLADLKIDHIVARSYVHLRSSGLRMNYKSYEGSIPETYIEKQDMLAELFDRNMVLRHRTPDRQILWYSFDKGS